MNPAQATPSNRGRLVTLEGGEGAGKSTLLAGLREHFEHSGLPPSKGRGSPRSGGGMFSERGA
jgi:thymidylate kinase